MTFNKSTRYALYAVLEMARAGAGRPIAVSRVAARYRISEGALAKTLQRLVRSGIAVGMRGLNGGYLLAKRPSDVTLLDVVSVFQPPRPLGRCLVAERAEPRCADYAECRLRGLFDEVEETVRSTFASVTVETLAGRPAVRASAPPAKARRS